MNDLITCKSCGTYFTGNFCNECGEKIFHENDKSIAHFFNESFHFITHLDNKVFRSLWLVFTQPARISKDLTNGIRKKHFKPLNLFLLGVILYLLFPFFPGLNLSLKNHTKQRYGSYSNYLIKQKMLGKHLTFDQVAAKFDEKSPKFAKVLLLIVIPFSGLVLAALFFKKRDYFSDHLALAAEINTFNLYFSFLIIPLLVTALIFVYGLFTDKSRFYIDDSIAVPLYLVIFGIYCIVAFINFYNVKKIEAVWKSVLFILIHMIILYFIYRIILLSAVFLFI